MVQKFGEFQGMCSESTLPVCNAFPGIPRKCVLLGIPVPTGNNNHLRNLGSILIDGVAILVTLGLLWLSQRKRAAVGRREMQVFLLGYLICCICEIFTVGGIPGLPTQVLNGFSAVHIGAIAATFWVLLLNAVVGYQFLDDGTPLSLGLVVGSAAAIFGGTLYIYLDTAFNFTGYFQGSVDNAPNVNNGLYVMYLIFPLVCLVFFFLLETYLVVKDLAEVRPMTYLVGALITFIIAMLFDFLVSDDICKSTNGAIDGTMFQTLFVLFTVALIWWFWNSITEDDWPSPGNTPVLP